MKTNPKFFFTGVILIAMAGIAGSQDKSSVVAAPKSAIVATPASSLGKNSITSSGLPIIGYLEKRDRVITIKAGPKGTIYGVATKDGKVLHENLSAEQLKAQAPELHDLIKTGVAGDARARSFHMDATLW